MVKLLSIIAALPLVALAIPVAESPDVLPAETYTVALDEDNKQMIAYDESGKKLGVFSMNANLPQRRSQCFPMSNEDISGIPKIEDLRKKADDKWGTGSRNEVVNDKDFPDRPANVCADDAGAKIIYDGEPSCKDVVNQAEGKLEGGKVILENREGVSMSGSNTVTRTTKWGIGRTISAKVSIPGIAEIGSEMSVSTEFTNEQGSTNTISQDQTAVQRIEQPVDEGQTCKMSLTTTSCSITGKASLKMIATGFLWFQYEDKTAPVNGDESDKHYKWGMVMEHELTNDDDRSTIIEFKTSGDVESQSHFDAFDCTSVTDSTGSK